MALRPGVLLDVDGTLVDSNYHHTLAWARAFADLGEWAPANAIHRLVGMGGDQLVPRLLGKECPEASPARARRYAELLPEVRAFPGAAELVRRLRELGLVTVIATSSPAAELDVAIDVLGVRGEVDAMTTADDAEASKPAPDILLAAMAAGGIDPARCVMVGDSVWDVEAAGAAGIACIGLETGGFSAHELREAGAVAVHHDVDDLRRRLLTSPIAHLVGR